MAKSFYNEYYASNEDATDACDTLGRVIDILLEEYCEEKGYSPRELSHLLCQEITLRESTWVILRASKMLKEKEI